VQTTARAVTQSYLAAVIQHDRTHCGQSQTDAAGVAIARGLQAEEPLKPIDLLNRRSFANLLATPAIIR
jgi:hypothetical protein